MKQLQKLTSSGDTIVEVLIVLATLSLAFSISLATANRALQQSQNAEEHSQALGLLNSQVEELRSAISQSIATSTTKSFCMTSTTQPSADFSGPTGVVPTDANINQDDYHIYDSPCKGQGANGFYNESITYVPSASPAQAYYDVRVRWDGLGNFGKQQEVFTYKVHQLSTPATIGIPINGALSQVAVKELDIPGDGTSTPTCTAANKATASLSGHSNVSIKLSDLTDTSKSQTGTTTSGSVTFTTGDDSHNYTSTINYDNGGALTGGSLPAHWQLCSQPSSPPVTQVTPSGNLKEIDFYMVPLCHSVPQASIWGQTGTSTSYAYSWWRTSNNVSGHERDWGPNGFATYATWLSSTSWEATIGINPANDSYNAFWGYFQQSPDSWGYSFDPSPYLGSSYSAQGTVLFQDYDKTAGNNPATPYWYNFYEEVTQTTVTPTYGWIAQPNVTKCGDQW